MWNNIWFYVTIAIVLIAIVEYLRYRYETSKEKELEEHCMNLWARLNYVGNNYSSAWFDTHIEEFPNSKGNVREKLLSIIRSTIKRVSRIEGIYMDTDKIASTAIIMLHHYYNSNWGGFFVAFGTYFKIQKDERNTGQYPTSILSSPRKENRMGQE